jgi:hypothetical protein
MYLDLMVILVMVDIVFLKMLGALISLAHNLNVSPRILTATDM